MLQTHLVTALQSRLRRVIKNLVCAKLLENTLLGYNINEVCYIQHILRPTPTNLQICVTQIFVATCLTQLYEPTVCDLKLFVTQTLTKLFLLVAYLFSLKIIMHVL